MSLLFVHSARQMVTLRGSPGPRRGPELSQLNIIDDGAVLIEDGVIREVGPTRRIENLSGVRKAREISAAGRVLMPGFVDCHTHVISGPSRFPDDSAIHGPARPGDPCRILSNVAMIRETSSRRLASDAAQVLRRSLSYGTTTIEAKSGYGLNASAELKILRILTALGDAPITVIPTFAAATIVPSEFEGRPAEYIDWLCRELLPLAHRRGLARFVDGSCGPGSFTAAELRPMFAVAHQLGLPMKMSLAQFGPAGYGEFGDELTFTSFDHLDHLDIAGVARLAELGSVATLTPASSFFLGAGKYAPARDLIERGVPVAIASNYCRLTSPTNNMQMVVFLAFHQMRMTAAEAVSAATINAAHALRLGHRVGSIEAGKQADLLILSVGDYRELAHEFGINLVDVTIKQGQVVCDSSGVKWPEGS